VVTGTKKIREGNKHLDVIHEYIFTDFTAKWKKSKIHNDNSTNTKHEYKVKYEGY
jgi:hypothetical protein